MKSSNLKLQMFPPLDHGLGPGHPHGVEADQRAVLVKDDQRLLAPGPSSPQFGVAWQELKREINYFFFY